MSAYRTRTWLIATGAIYVFTVACSSPTIVPTPTPIPTVTLGPTIPAPAPEPTATPIPTSTPEPTEIPDGTVFGAPTPTLGISRSRIQSEFAEAGYRFDMHAADWYVGNFFDGTGSAISVEIFGTADDIEAVELWFGGKNDAKAVIASIELLMLRLSPSRTDSLLRWFGDSYPRLGSSEMRTTLGPILVKLQRSQRSGRTMLSFERNPS